MFTENLPFEIGKALRLHEGTDVTIFATGHLVWNAIEAAKVLANEGISVELINIHTIKPLDEKAVLASVAKTRAVVTAEERNYMGGLGETIAGLLSRKLPTAMEMVAVQDSFGESGEVPHLMTKYGLDPVHVVEAVRKVLARK
jgi:transketolase